MQSIRSSWCLRKASKLFTKSCLKDTNYSLYAQQFLSSSASTSNRPHVAIVGSGPAGYYTAQQLLKGHPNLSVDIYEKLPVPFGLVRFGVAPDHPEVKNVINTFTTTAHNERCNFIGNVEIGTDVSLKELRDAYTAVVLCYGAADDRLVGIPGEDSTNVLSARSFVGWYNGLPEDAALPVDLDCESAVVLGQGNVALDVARILLTPIDILKKTDITEQAIEALSKSRVKRVHVVGRRGPLQVAFTIKELREMIHLADTRTVIQPADVDGLDKLIKDLPRPRRRLTELMYKSGVSPGHKESKSWESASREWRLVFKRTPLQILQDNNSKVKGVEFAINRLEGDSFDKQRAVTTDVTEVLQCGLVLRSIGYKGLPLKDSVPFDFSRGVIDNENSRVSKQQGLYCAGWIGHGPVGVINDTMSDGFHTGKVLLSDMKSRVLQPTQPEKRNIILQNLSSKAVSFSDWEKIDKAETEAGDKIGKPREKMTDIEQMIRIARS